MSSDKSSSSCSGSLRSDLICQSAIPFPVSLFDQAQAIVKDVIIDMDAPLSIEDE